jgi:hypothetical protein
MDFTASISPIARWIVRDHFGPGHDGRPWFHPKSDQTTYVRNIGKKSRDFTTKIGAVE